MIDKPTEDAIFADVVRMVSVAGAGGYIKHGDLGTNREWKEGAIRHDIRKYWDEKAGDRFDTYVPRDFPDKEFSQIAFWAVREIARKGGGKDDKLLRKTFHIKRKKPGGFLGAIKSAAESVAKVAAPLVAVAAPVAGFLVAGPAGAGAASSLTSAISGGIDKVKAAQQGIKSAKGALTGPVGGSLSAMTAKRSNVYSFTVPGLSPDTVDAIRRTNPTGAALWGI